MSSGNAAPYSLETSNPLFLKLVERIRRFGALTVEQYMESVLHDPEHGYYRHGNPLGLNGDFITSPDVSRLFGEMLGIWLVKAWECAGSPSAFVLCEVGPGQGTLLEAALAVAKGIQPLRQAMQLRLVESNQTLRHLQMSRLGIDASCYVGSIAELPELPLIFIANEFFDTLPLRQFVRELFGWRERVIGLSGGALAFEPGGFCVCPDGLGVMRALSRRRGAIYEFSQTAKSIMQAAAQHIGRHRGAGIVIDYGYRRSPECSTLDALSRHKFVDVLTSPGDVDVTANVDFGMFAATARREGLRVAKLVNQRSFLRSIGLLERAENVSTEMEVGQRQDLVRALQLLLSDEGLGGLKVFQMCDGKSSRMLRDLW